MNEGPLPGSRWRAMLVLLALALGTAGLLAWIDPKVGGGDVDGRGPIGSRPNVILIVAPPVAETGLETMSRTLRLLGEKGATFTNAYAPDSCCASEITLLEGRLLHNRGTESLALPAWLEAVGYDTSAVGYDGEAGTLDSELSTDAVTQLEELLPRSDPFLLSVAYPGGTPSQCGESEPADPPGTPDVNEPDVSDKPRAVRRRKRISERELAAIAGATACLVELIDEVDRGVAKIVRAVRDAGELNRTVIAFTAAAGPDLVGQHRITFSNSYPYLPAWRVPLIVRGGGAEAGVEVETPVTTTDLAPAMLAFAGAKDEPEAPLDGRSWLPALTGGRLPTRDFLFEGRDGDGEPLWASILRDEMLYTRWADGDEELYDLAADPFQLRSLHRVPTYADELEELATGLERLRTCAGTELDRVGDRVPCA